MSWSDPSPQPELRARTRDRRDRGLRVPLVPRTAPGYRSRSELFEHAIQSSVLRFERHLGPIVRSVDFEFTTVPPQRSELGDSLDIPLGICYPSQGNVNARIVLYRMPISARCTGQRELQELIHEVLSDNLGHLLGIDPDQLLAM